MKINILTLGICACLYSSTLFAQYEITIDASIYDQDSKQPIPFVNVEFEGKQVRTISDQNGSIKLIFDENKIDDSDVLQFEVLGYKSEQISASQFYKFLTNTNKIYLKPKSFLKATENYTKYIDAESNPIPVPNINGTISSKFGPIQGAKIKVKNSLNEVFTDVNGHYGIVANTDDVLQIVSLGMIPKEISVSNFKSFDVSLESDGELLDEIFLEGESDKQPRYDLGYNGKKKFDEITYSVGIISPKEIKSHYYNIGDLLNGRLSKLNYNKDQSITNRTNFIYDVDGMIFSGVDIPILDPQLIESIVVLNTLSATHKYGTLGRNGVVVIKTKANGYNAPIPEAKSALVQGNDFNETLPKLNELTSSSFYIKQLQKATTFEEAKERFQKQISVINKPSVSYFIETSDYFLKWDKDFAIEVLSSIEEIAYNNAKALRTYAYKLDQLNMFKQAKTIYHRIIYLKPNEAQSYRDLAQVYEETQGYQEAMNLYVNMLNNTIKDVDFSGIKSLIVADFSHFMKFHRSKVDYSGVPSEYLKADYKLDRRIIVAWNDPYAQFELEFISPQRKSYAWSYTKLNNPKRMLRGIKKGDMTEEYVIDDAQPGNWMINIESHDSQKELLNPTYVKYTVYTNYGLENETKEIKVINLNHCRSKLNFDTLASN